MVSQTLRSKVSRWPPQTDSHLTGRNVRCQELGWHRVVFTEFFTVSASSMFYCSFPEFKCFVFFLPDSAQYPLLLPEDNKLPNLTVVHSTERGSHRARPRPHLPVHITFASHTWTPLSFPHYPNRSLSSHSSKAMVFPVTCTVLCMAWGYNPTTNPCNSQVLFFVLFVLHINHLSFRWKCHFVCENKTQCVLSQGWKLWHF